MSNLFYRGGGVRAGGFQFVYFKRSEEKLYGPVHFFQGGGGLFAYSYAKKIHNTLVATFNIMAIILSLK